MSRSVQTLALESTPVSRSELSQSHFHNLDLLRAVAVLCVLASHIALAMGIRVLGSLGRFGVIMFFFHTSFVLMQSLERMHKSATGWRLTFAFWIRRACRIYPLAILAVLVAVSFHVPVNGFGTYHAVSRKELFSNLALAQNLTYTDDVLGPLWSLPLEVQMYVLLPAAYLLIRRWTIPPFLLWIGSIVLALTLPHVNDRLEVFRFAPCFAAGILAFQLDARKKKLVSAWTWPLSLLVAALIFGPFDNISLPAKIYLAWLVSLLLALAYVYTRDAQAGLVSRVTHKLADISYGIYLAHILLIFATERLFRPGLPADCFFAASVIVVPMLLHRFIELPFMSVGRLLSRNLLHPAKTARPNVTLTGEPA